MLILTAKENTMLKQLFLSLSLIMLLLTGCTTAAQDNPQAFPPDVVADMQAEMDDLIAGEFPPGMIVWIDAPAYRFEGASGSANLTEMVVDETTGNVTLNCVERDPNDTLARYVYGKEAQFEPGTQWRYSNSNYTLLGMVIEAATEMPLAEAYRTNIYEPLGMISTFLDCYEEPLITVVHGYTSSGDAMADVTELHESVGWSAGGLVSSFYRTGPDQLCTRGVRWGIV